MSEPILGEQQFVPNQLVTSDKTRFYRDPVSGALSVQYTKDGGTTWKQFIGEPSSLATEGWVPSLTATGDVVWRPISSLIAGNTAAASAQWVEFSYPQSLSSGKEFGYFKVPSGQNMECYGFQVSVIDASGVSPTICRIVNVNDGLSTAVGPEIILAVGQLTGSGLIDPISMRADSEWRMTISSVGASQVGGFLSCRLLLNTVQ